MNKCIFIGNLTKDPEIRQAPNGDIVGNFTIAVNRDYTKDGVREADFIRITVWRGLADACGKCLVKGSKVAVSGRLTNYTYEDKEGVKRSGTEIVAADVEFLPSLGSQDVRTEHDNVLPF